MFHSATTGKARSASRLAARRRQARRLVAKSLVLLSIVMLPLLTASGQDTTETTPSPAAEPTTRAAADPIRFLRLGAEYGVRQYRPGHWGVVGVDVANFSDQEATVVAQVGFRSDATELYARRIWVPANSVRRTWVSIHMPEDTTTPSRQDLVCQLIVENESGQTVKARRDERREHVNSIRLIGEPLVTGIIVPTNEVDKGQSLDPGYEMVIAARNAAALGRQTALIGERYLPPIPEAYDAVDQLVLYNDRFAEDAASCAAIRQWLLNGGHIWMQLDRVQLSSAARLLGERFRCEEVDRVELHDIEIVTSNPRQAARYTGRRRYELPVPFVRMAVEDVEVTHRVNGWPAAFNIPFGRGRVVATTLGGDAWVVEGREPRNLNQQGRFDASPELDELELVMNRRPTPADRVVMSSYLESQIGYRVVGRSWVVTTLSAFCLFLFAAGAFLLARGGLERMTWIAPLGAVVAAAPLVFLGARAQQSAPPSVAMAQYVEVGDASRSAHVSGALALYRPEPGTVTFGSDRGGVYQLQWDGLERTIRRFVRSDVDRWRWEQVRLTSGVRKANIQQNIKLPAQIEARGTFDENGFRGRLRGAEPLEDALLAAPGRPVMGVRFEDSTMLAGPADQLASGQYVVGALLSEEQRRRQAVYAQMFENSTQDHPFPSRRLLLGWTEPLDLGFQFPENTRTVGGALLAAPLLLDRPESGQRILIPSPFLRLKSTSSPDGRSGGSPLFNARTGEWVSSQVSSQSWLLCQPPEELLPLSIERAIVRLKCTAPSRELTLSAGEGEQSVPLLTRKNPIGPLELVIDRPELLQIGADGGFRVGVSIGELLNVDPDSDLRWSIDYLDIELQATVD